MNPGYGQDLAHIHDVGFTGFASRAAPALLALLPRGLAEPELVVDLGCGPGVWARALVDAGYDVLGVDLSRAMIGIARRRVPQARFAIGSLFEAELPSCVAVTAIGECVNYLFDTGNDHRGLARLFARVHEALRPGGVIVFDAAGPGRAPTEPSTSFRETRDWALVLRAEQDRHARVLTRHMTIFRRVASGKAYRRSIEIHRLRLYPPRMITSLLRRAGFRVRELGAYGRLRLPRGYRAFVARKPRS